MDIECMLLLPSEKCVDLEVVDGPLSDLDALSRARLTREQWTIAAGSMAAAGNGVVSVRHLERSRRAGPMMSCHRGQYSAWVLRRDLWSLLREDLQRIGWHSERVAFDGSVKLGSGWSDRDFVYFFPIVADGAVIKTPATLSMEHAGYYELIAKIERIVIRDERQPPPGCWYPPMLPLGLVLSLDLAATVMDGCPAASLSSGFNAFWGFRPRRGPG